MNELINWWVCYASVLCNDNNNCMDYYSFTDPGWMEGWVVLVG